jgi:WD40 repeat protein
MRIKRDRKKVNYVVDVALPSSSESRSGSESESGSKRGSGGSQSVSSTTPLDSERMEGSSDSSEGFKPVDEGSDSDIISDAASEPSSKGSEPEDDPTVLIQADIRMENPVLSRQPVKKFTPKIFTPKIPNVTETVNRQSESPKPSQPEKPSVPFAPQKLSVEHLQKKIVYSAAPVKLTREEHEKMWAQDPNVKVWQTAVFETLKRKDLVTLIVVPTKKSEEKSLEVDAAQSRPNPRTARLMCPIPFCTADYLQREGVLSHMKANVHDALDFLQWAFPKDPSMQVTLKMLEADANRWVEEDVLSRVSEEGVALYKQVPAEAWPISTMIKVLIPMGGNLYELPFIIGMSRARKDAIGFVESKPKLPPRPMPSTIHVTKPSTKSKKRILDDDGPLQKKQMLELADTPMREHVHTCVAEQDLHVKDEDMERYAEELAEKYRHKDIKPSVYTNVMAGAAHKYLQGAKGVRVKYTVRKNPHSFHLRSFEAQRLGNSQSIVCSTGGTIHALDWCPGISKYGAQYVAVGGYPDCDLPAFDKEPKVFRSMFKREAGKNNIQIWQVGVSSISGVDHDTFLALVILHEYGSVRNLHWCQYGGYEVGTGEPKRLGLLAATFGDGSLRVFSIPRPETVGNILPVFMDKVQCVFEIFTPDVSFSACKWGGWEWLAAGTVEGFVILYDMEAILSGKNRQKHATMMVRLHDTLVTDLDWNDVRLQKVDSRPYQLVTTGWDGRTQVVDVRQPFLSFSLAKQRYFANAVKWAPNLPMIDLIHGRMYSGSGAVFWEDRDNSVRVTWPTEMQGAVGEDDDKAFKSIGVSYHGGIVWSIDASRFHPFAVSGGEDGTVRVSNVNRVFERHLRPILSYLFMAKHEDTEEPGDSFSYIPGTVVLTGNIQPEEYITKTANPVLHFSEYCSINRVKWCPEAAAHGWIASGLSSGLMRFDNVYEFA